jgi:hypothetical protein
MLNYLEIFKLTKIFCHASLFKVKNVNLPLPTPFQTVWIYLPLTYPGLLYVIHCIQEGEHDIKLDRERHL